MARLFYFWAMRKLVLFIFISVILGCNNEQNNDTLFRLLSSSSTGIDFSNDVQDQKDFNVLTYRNYYNGGGVAIGDINGDGLADIFFTANMGPNKLFLNKGNMTFSDISEAAGIEGGMSWSTGVTMADINADGLIDIYVCNSGDVAGENKKNELFINNGDLTFSEKAKEYGLDDSGFSTHGSFFDFDRDGDLDFYLLNNSFKDPSRIDFTNVRNIRDKEGGDKLFRNDGNVFVDVSESAGIYGSKIGFGLGISVSDINGDQWPDMYISNDFWERDYLYINQKDGTFLEELTSRIPMTSTASMGADIVDLNNDGSFEIFSTDMLPATNKRLKETTIFNNYNLEDLRYRNDYHYQYTQNCLQLNDGTGHFREIAHITGTAATDWSWAALSFDFDNDGWKDIFVSNGVKKDITDLDFSSFIEDQEEVAKIVKEKGEFNFDDFLEYLPSNPLSNYAFLNHQNLSFSNRADSLGLGQKTFSNGSAYGDLDNDGDLDLVVNVINEEALIYENRSNENQNNFISISFQSESRNKYGIGATVILKTGDNEFHHQNYQSRGFQSATEPRLTIGIGAITKVDEIKVLWPSGSCSTIYGAEANSHINVKEDPNESCEKTPNNDEEITWLTEDPNRLPDDSRHSENLFNDFDFENLMPHMVSNEGPEVLKGDINGDELEDLILLSSIGESDRVLKQTQEGKFEGTDQPHLEKVTSLESTCGLLIDLDYDNDLDLLIGNGGNDPRLTPEDYTLRVYLNDGSGKFIPSENLGLAALGNFSVIEEVQLSPSSRAIFIGARIIPGNYGLVPRSYLFVEVAPGNWQDFTSAETGPLGMITDAVSVDIDSDGSEDLVVVGEWMPIIIFKNNNGVLAKMGSVKESNGLWQTIASADLNNDKLPELIVGNWGQNSKLQANVERPLSMIVGDFDKNQKSECLIQWFAPEDDKSSLFASKNDLANQLPMIKKEALKNSEYASKDITDLLDKSQLALGQTSIVNNLSSSVLWNRGEMRFDLEALPNEAQYSPIFAIAPSDINADGFIDIVLGGNVYGLKPEIGRLDSSNGLVLENRGDETYSALHKNESGLYIKGEIRSITPVQVVNGNSSFIFGINNSEYRLLSVSL